ncbi:MAG: hypothetical protein PVG68_19870, partial [Desulfobacterales bacterium]
MKIDENLLNKCISNKYLFYFSSIFTLWASLSASDFALRASTGQVAPTRRAHRRLPSVRGLLRTRHPPPVKMYPRPAKTEIGYGGDLESLLQDVGDCQMPAMAQPQD